MPLPLHRQRHRHRHRHRHYNYARTPSRTHTNPLWAAAYAVNGGCSDDGFDLDCEETPGIVWNAHIAATGKKLPHDAFRIQYPKLDPAWNFDFDDRGEMTRRLPRLAALFLE